MSTSTERGEQCTASSDGIRCVSFSGHPPILPGIEHNYGGLGPFTPIVPTPTVDPRPNWDDTRLPMAQVLRQRSRCSRDRVGAIIVDKFNKVIGEGYNGPAAGLNRGHTCLLWCPRAKRGDAGRPLDGDYDDCDSLHAEANALMMSDRSLRLGGTIYVTSHVCFSCAKLIANSGLARVVVSALAEANWRRPELSYRYLREAGLTVDLKEVP